MFRYLALAWDDKNTAHGAVAGGMVGAMQSADNWQCALESAGLHVFVRGRNSGIYDAYSLGSAEGVILGRLFRRRDAGRVQTGAALRTGEQQQILRSCGQALVNEYWGRYVAFLRSADGRCVIRDPVGGLPCFQLEHEGVRIVFSWLEDVLCLLREVPVPRVAWDCLAAHIAFVSIAGRETVLEGVTQIFPGERVSLPPAAPSSRLLWNAASFAGAPCQIGPRAAAAELRSTVRATVQSWAGTFERILMRLSGGLDSSIVLSCLDASVNTDVTCINYHSPGSNSDERSYARLAALRAGRRLLERDRNADYPLEHVLDVARTPLPPSYLGRLGSARMDAALSRELHTDAMFNGGGGDQLFFQFRDWWAAADYLSDRGLDTGFWNASMDAARIADLSVWRVMRLALQDHWGCPAPEPGVPAHLALAVTGALPDAVQRRRFEHPEAESFDAMPLAKRLHLQLLLAPTDTYDPYEREAAPEIVNPLLSQPVLEYCLALPTYLLTAGGQPRALARRAFVDDIPPQIATRHSKGGMEEYLTTILRRNANFARALLLEGELVRRGLVDGRKIEAILSDRPTTLAAHTTEIHIYLGIEAWLQRMRRQP